MFTVTKIVIFYRLIHSETKWQATQMMGEGNLAICITSTSE